MPAERLRMTLADYVVLALNPALIMGLVGSLVFFLLEVFYSGAYDGRMQLILFSFVVAIVLITRITLTAEIADRAGLYGLVLGVLVYIGMQKFVTYSEESSVASFGWLINLGLMAVVWWSAHRLTKDCTHLDNDAEIGNEGLLDAAELGGATRGENKNEKDSDEEPSAGSAGKPLGWLARYEQYSEQQRKKKRTPGVWVVYFSVAALPLFGLGQALISTEAGARRKYTFLLLCLYVACGLGLLLTTAFLGIRRYLRQRGARMPAALTGAWLSSGALLIIGFLGAAAVLPRPLAEYTLVPYPGAGAKKLDASKHGTSGDEAGEGKGKPGAQRKDSKTDDAEKDVQGNSKGKDASSKSEKDRASGKDGKGQENGGKKSNSQDKNSKQSKNSDDTQKESRGKSSEQKKDGAQAKGNDKESQKNDKQSDSSRPPSRSFQFTEKLQGLATVLKWIVFAVIAALVVFMLVRNGLRFLANFTDWARRLLDAWNNFWNRLFAREAREAVHEETVAEAALGLPPFAAFSDPFADGRARRMTTRQLANYSFQALEAWAAERDLERAEGETPLEFTRRVGGEAPVAEASILRLGQLYVHAAYGPDVPPSEAVQELRRFWQALLKIGEGALTA